MSIFTNDPEVINNRQFQPGEGYLAVAPYRTVAPTDGTSPLGSSWQDLGIVSEDGGPSESREVNTTERRAWPSGRVVSRAVTSSALNVNVTFVEVNEGTVELFYGAAPDANGRVVVVPGRFGGKFAMVIDLYTGDMIVRSYYPNCEITAVGDQQVGVGEALTFPVTITCETDPAVRDENGRAGACVKWFIPLSQASAPPTDLPNLGGAETLVDEVAVPFHAVVVDNPGMVQ